MTPLVVRSDRQYSNENENSLALRLSHGHVDLLLTGDAEAGAKCAILRSGLKLDADVLKVGHHGSDTSSWGCPGFLVTASPTRMATTQSAQADLAVLAPDLGPRRALGASADGVVCFRRCNLEWVKRLV